MARFKKGHNLGFTTGNKPHNKHRKCVKLSKSDIKVPEYKRLTKKMTDLVQNIPYKEDKTVITNTTVPCKLMRPTVNASKKAKPGISAKDKQRKESETNRMIHVGLNAKMWNEVFREHTELHPRCRGFLEWDMSREVRWGMGNSEIAICNMCNYQSKRFKLYDELDIGKRGRRAAKMNIGLQASSCQTTVSATGIRKIILGTNCPAPSATGMQKRANAVLPQIVEINKQDMKARRKRLVEINKLRGKENPNAVSLQGDGAYNNLLYTGIGRTPFQPATQVVYTVAENETEDKNIITVIAKNKLCSVHPVDPKSGKNENCTEECSSNITFMKSIGDEYSWAKEALTDLKTDDIEAKHFTTDPDSSDFKAAEDLFHEKITETEPVHFLDTRHYAYNHRKNIKKNQAILKMMPGKNNAEREKLQNNFANDLAARCQGEISQAMQRYGGDFSKVKSKLSFTCDAIPLCYMDKHELCRQHSYLCNGGKKNWLNKSAFLKKNFKIVKKCDNIAAISNCVLYRLGPNALEKTKLNLNTQKVEGFNRCLRRALPKALLLPKTLKAGYMRLCTV